ncbi:MAG: PD40 domain-containing protein [Anaerolineae bacterium]|nr:PD40 domain-containing protein [Anaerolineae bacterium]
MSSKRVILTGLLGIAIALITFAGLHGTGVQAQVIPSNQVVFASDRSGNYEIFLLDPATGLTTQITNLPANDVEPVWSPDGSLIAFASDRDGDYELYVMRADGTDVRQLTNNLAEDRLPRWQLDGLSLVFVSDVNGQWDLYSISADGAVVKQLTNDPADERGPDAASAGLLPGPGGAPQGVPTITPGVAPVTGGNATVDSYELNVRQNPGEGARILQVIPRDTPVTILGRYYDNSWVQVQTPSGIVGWVAARLLDINISLASVPVIDVLFVNPPPTPTPTPTIPPEPTILFYASDGTINEGECVTLYWHVEYIKEVYYQGEGVVGQGSRQECPTETTTYTLRVVKLDGSIKEYYFTVTVIPADEEVEE